MARELRSENYNWSFNTNTGFFVRWGKEIEDDPQFSPFGPELLDIEVSTVCSRACPWCYKSNTKDGENMDIDTFRKILDKLPENLTQVAFGVGDIDANPDLWDMMEYCRDRNVVPNITINGQKMTRESYKNLAKFCGAVAVSYYDKFDCSAAVENLSDAGIKQVNIHYLLAYETIDNLFGLMKEHTSRYWRGLNAIVLLMVKPKGSRNRYHRPNFQQFKQVVDFAIDNDIRLGFDSCSAPMFLEAVKDKPTFKMYKTVAEFCESSLFSYYVNVNGIGFPCSFTEGEMKGVDVQNSNDFINDVWDHKITKEFREKLLKNKRNCPQFRL